MVMVLALPLFLLGCGVRTTVPSEPTYPQTFGDFRIDISVSSTTLRRGENIEVFATFRNLSGERLEIEITGFFIMGWIVVGSEWTPRRLAVAVLGVLEIDEVIENTFEVGSLLPRGQHELIVDGRFTIYRPSLDDIQTTERIRVISNTIILTVR